MHNYLYRVVVLYEFPVPTFLLINLSRFYNLDCLKTSGTHLYTVSIFFMYFDYEFLFFGIEGFLFKSKIFMSCCFLV